jgi:hypothetical protein
MLPKGNRHFSENIWTAGILQILCKWIVRITHGTVGVAEGPATLGAARHNGLV